ncbi:hypothetical protein HanPI659440_Chr11g0427071 [Helianthus annuus]|nr:hypothetical protein HanPI659440_Chr11g0427071 [Helianthus annuus]
MFKGSCHFVRINLVNDLHSYGGLIYSFLVILEFFQSIIGRLFFKSVGTWFHLQIGLKPGFRLQIGFKPGSVFNGFLI